ncbi:MAG TPA: GNAT family N-acetyltransferase [Planctomycetota bacterium]|nr:GNAT family N-acetyltransferase [Planctomycetota bacterium]
MEIREARRQDFEALEALVRAVFHDEYATTTEWVFAIEGIEGKLRSIREEFDAIGSRFLLAEEAPGGKLLGAVLVRIPRNQDRVWVEDLFVLPDARRQGVATELIQAACPPEAEVCCEVNRKNAVAQETFKALGFEPVVETIVFRRRAPG